MGRRTSRPEPEAGEVCRRHSYRHWLCTNFVHFQGAREPTRRNRRDADGAFELHDQFGAGSHLARHQSRDPVASQRLVTGRPIPQASSYPRKDPVQSAHPYLFMQPRRINQLAMLRKSLLGTDFDSPL